jgi:hypothetical protein
MSFSFGLLVVIGVIVLVTALGYYNYLAEKKRTAQFQSVAAALGFRFSAQGSTELEKALSGFHLFSQGHGKKLWNLLRNTTENLEVAIFDYRFTVGGGKHQHTSKQSVIAFRFAGPKLPKFFLRPEGFWDKIGSWMGFQDIDFDDHPLFSSRYLLRGDDEKAVRQLFTTPILDYYTNNTGLTTEGCGQILLFYRHEKRIEPQEVRSFMEEGWKVLALFHPAE